MTSDLQLVDGIGKKTAERMKEHGIDSIPKLASSSVEDLLKINGIGNSTAKKYIHIAQNFLEDMERTENEKNNILRSNYPNSKNLNETIKVPKRSILEEILSNPILSSLEDDDPQSSFSEERLDEPKPSNEEETSQMPIKSYVSLKKENIPLSKLQKSKNESKQRKIRKIEKKTSYQKSSKITPKSTKSQHPIQKSNLKIKHEEVKKSKSSARTFFSPETMQKIRFFHYKVKHIETAIHKGEDFSFHDLDSVIEYVDLLNINYKTQSQIKILRELEITPKFFDPLEKKEIEVWDLMFECARVLWVAAKACSHLSKKFEKDHTMKNAIVAMVECSKMYKAASYFSAACTRQEEMGTTLSSGNLELRSEESRILAQNLATIREEEKKNFSLASKLHAGLSALTKRLYFLKRYNIVKEKQLKAQYNYDIGKACHLKAKFLSKISENNEDEEIIEDLQKKANYYFYKAEETWEKMLNDIKELTNTEKDNIRNNLSIVNEDIMQNDVEIIKQSEAMKIQDPEPLIIVPENLAPFLPRTTNYLMQYKPKDLNFDAYKRYKDLISEISIDYNELEELTNKKAGIGRTLKQLKILYANNDIDISMFTHLFEKYSNKLVTIEKVIEKLKNPDKKNIIEKKKIHQTKSQT
ncbi:MAG: helix-hairpin-helix domain-containing protein [Promethearchaeota archaeon]